MAHDLASLITVVDGILQQDRILDDLSKALVESLLEKATSLKNLLEKSVTQHRLRGNEETIQELQSEIRDAAHEAEDIIESHLVDQTLSEPEATRFVISLPDHSITKVMEKFDAANDKLTKIIIKLQSRDEGGTTVDAIFNPSLSAAADLTIAATMVGFEEDALQLKHRLTSQKSAREIIPIVGMGGIGKTTLARNLYNDPLVVSHFDVRAWVTVSQDYNVQAVLLGLLGSISRNNYENMLSLNSGDDLYQRLCGRRYLVVLDDVWSEKAWDEMQRYFPNESHRSRILITSRELHVAKHADSACKEHQMHLLSDAQGWNLLCHKVFQKDEKCPQYLEEIGQKIASDCGGLPLAITVIGGLLSVEKYSKDLWDEVAKDVRSIASRTDNDISKVLCLSYDNLPLHLKPCFLYMSAFPEDFNVRHSKLVKLWAAEGFLWRSNGKNDRSLEAMAEEYLKALVDRNLLSVTSTKYNGRARSYSMHDLLRDLCVRKADEEKFLSIGKYKNVSNLRRVSVHQVTGDEPVPDEDLSHSRSLICIVPVLPFIDISYVLFTLRLVRVLDVFDVLFSDFPIEVLKLANLRFLAVFFEGSLPPAIWRLRNLKTLRLCMLFSNVVMLPYEAWEISSLRHIILKSNTTIYIDFKIPRVHENLQTIRGVSLRDLLASNLINNIPNIRELGITGHRFVSKDKGIDLSHLHKLETLELENFSVAVLSILELPDCLKKLSLCESTLPMELVNGVGDLQYLEVIKIKTCKFQSEEHSEEEEDDDDEEEEDSSGESEWEVNEEVEFCSLQFLELSTLYIKRWKADFSNFPRLRRLRIRDCEDLVAIPACIGEMTTLEMIEVNKDNPSHMAWANEVRETQRHEYGNETLQIHHY